MITRATVVTAPIVPANVRPASGELSRVLGGMLAVGICVVLAFAVMAFGSVEYWATCILQVASATLLLIWAAGQWANGKFSIAWTPLFVPALLLGVLIGFQLLGHTAYWYATWVKSIQWACYATMFFVSTQSFRGEGRAKLLGMFLVCFGSLVALIAIAQGGTESDKVFWLFPTDTHSVLYGPYPNHAHYAGLMEMLLPMALVLGLGFLFRTHAKVLLLFAALIMAGSIFLAASFGGILSFVGELLVLAILLLRHRRRHRALLSILVLVLLLSILVVMLQPAALQERLEHARTQAEQSDVTSRVAIVRDSVPMIWQRPLLGYGLGNFVEVFPSFRTFYTDLLINAAHNDYVQAVVEIGLVGFALIGWLIFLLYRDGLRKIRSWEHDYESSVTLAALVGCSGILIHSFCDFNLQVPANAALFAVLAGAAVTKRSDRGGAARQGATAFLPFDYVRELR